MEVADRSDPAFRYIQCLGTLDYEPHLRLFMYMCTRTHVFWLDVLLFPIGHLVPP